VISATTCSLIRRRRRAGYCGTRASDEVRAWLCGKPEHVDRLDPRSFEVIVADVIRERGWEVDLTKQTRDGGYDILAIRSDACGFPVRLLIECKLYGRHS
jgi:hypothetical protein